MEKRKKILIAVLILFIAIGIYNFFRAQKKWSNYERVLKEYILEADNSIGQANISKTLLDDKVISRDMKSEINSISKDIEAKCFVIDELKKQNSVKAPNFSGIGEHLIYLSTKGDVTEAEFLEIEAKYDRIFEELVSQIELDSNKSIYRIFPKLFKPQLELLFERTHTKLLDFYSPLPKYLKSNWNGKHYFGIKYY